MELLYKLLFAYLLLINAVGLGIMCADKQFAKKITGVCRRPV